MMTVLLEYIDTVIEKLENQFYRVLHRLVSSVLTTFKLLRKESTYAVDRYLQQSKVITMTTVSTQLNSPPKIAITSQGKWPFYGFT